MTEERKTITCSVCHRAIYTTDVDDRKRCPDCQPVPKEPKP